MKTLLSQVLHLLVATRNFVKCFNFINYLQPSAKSLLWEVVYVLLHPIASRPIKVTAQLVPFLAPVDTDSAVLRLLSVERVEPGAEM